MQISEPTRKIDFADMGHYRNDLVFPMVEYEARVKRVRDEMRELGYDALMLTTPENIFYLCGYQTLGYWYFQALFLPLKGEPFMVVRELETPNISGRTYLAYGFQYKDQDDPADKLKEAVEHFDLQEKIIGVEYNSYFIRHTEFERIRKALPKCKFKECSGLVEKFRVVKSKLEIKNLRKAGRFTKKAIKAALDVTKIGNTENDVAATLYHSILTAGSNYMALPPFVASGPRSFLAHATFDNRTIEPNEFILLECAGCYQRYHSPCMRTIYTGKSNNWFLEIEAVLREALSVSIAAMRPGVSVGEIDDINQSIISKNNFGGRQTSRTGYSIGIAFPPDWGEGHIVSLVSGNETILEKNMAFHVLSYIEIPASKYASKSRFGLTDSVYVTDKGGKSLIDLDYKFHFTS